MVHKKTKSKRQTLRQKHKIERKVREHHRKQRRAAKKNPRRSLKKDPGIPNLHPYKEQMLEKLAQQRERAKEHAEGVKARRRQLQEKARARNMAELAAQAQAANEEYEEAASARAMEEEGSRNRIHENSRQSYFREFKKVMEASDVLLEVLDARDPIGCRCLDVEGYVMSKDPSKRIILVLNKIDLVPKAIAMQWLKYLRSQLPTIAFKCSTQTQRHNLRRSKVKANVISERSLKRGSECVGANHLIELLKNYSRNAKMKQALTVGIVGYPNVGKSSLINSLKRSKAVGVGSTPGFTSVMQEVHLDKKIRLLDCPGIVFSSKETTDAGLVLRNCVKLEQLEDPLAPVEVILRRCQPEQLMRLYTIAAYSDSTEFLELVAKRRGRFSKGVPDYHAAARIVLQDWNSGRIPFYTIPPAIANASTHQAEIVTQWSKEFDLDSVDTVQVEAINEMCTGDDEAAQSGTSAVVMDASRALPAKFSFDDEDGEAIPIAVERPISRHDSAAAAAADAVAPVYGSEDEDALNPQENRKRRMALRQQRKLRNKERRRQNNVLGGRQGQSFDTDNTMLAVDQKVDADGDVAMVTGSDSGSDYDFSQDFMG